jgi:hypothetical protein
VRVEDQQQYAAVLARAYSSDGLSDPQGFLRSLSTSELGFGDYATHSMTFLQAFHPPTADGTVATGMPSDQLGSYRTIVDNYLEMLDACRGMLAEGQYERDQPFFSRLQSLLANA